MTVRLPRLTTGIVKIDQWIDQTLSAIEKALNVSYQSPLYVVADSPKAKVIGMRTPIGIYFAITKTTVAAGTYGGPTATTVTLLDWNGSALVSSGVDQDCYFPWPTSASIGSGKLVVIVYFAGAWIIVAADCT